MVARFMVRPSKSQWDFGELFPPESVAPAPAKPQPDRDAPPAVTRRILSVAELTSQIRSLLEQHIGSVWVTGEVSNFRAQNSGHVYFTLKDAGAQLSCVLFRGETVSHRELLRDGQKLLLRGEISVYEARGQYQLIVRAVELQGTGALQIAFEKLKQKLQAEGLFARERKRPLPKYPQRIGLVTSPTGAAIRDVLQVVRRRNPGLEILFTPCRVQGDGAAAEIAAAIRLLNEFKIKNPDFSIDLILLTRGGGSLEDLWAFNEEVVARAIFESAIPIVSAVGHEIDFTISDFVADVRAPTPSVGAEIITEGVFSSCAFIEAAAARISRLTAQQLTAKDDRLAQAIQRLAREHPRRRINDLLQLLDDLQGNLRRCLRRGVRDQRVAFKAAIERLGRVRPATLLKHRRQVFEQERSRLREQVRHALRERQNQLSALQTRLRLLGPDQVLSRGYSITMNAATGKVLRAVKDVKSGERLKTRLKSGEVFSRVEKSEN
jgi:exodeoxyribonuclease VII large subunit